MGVVKGYLAAAFTAAVTIASPAMAVDFVNNFAVSAPLATYMNVNNLTTPAAVYSPDNFRATFSSPTLVTAKFSDTLSTGTFEDTYFFRTDLDGLGSGNLSTSFTTSDLAITISNIIINGVSYGAPVFTPGVDPGTGSSSFGQTNIPIGSFAPTNFINSIKILGTVTGVSGGYQGGLTFVASAVPEPASWAMMVLGFGVIGAACRRGRNVRTSVSFS